MAQRQFRSDDTDKWNYGFGNGADGAYSSAGNATIGANEGYYATTFAGTAGQTSGTLGGAWTWNGPCIIHQTRGTGAGNWELNWIVVSNSTSASFKHALMNSYATSGASAAQIITLKQWSSFTVNGGHTLTVPAWNGSVGGIFPILINGTASIAGAITASAKGFRGGAGRGSCPNGGGATQGEGNTGEGTYNLTTGAANGSGGGAAWKAESGANYNKGGAGGGGRSAGANCCSPIVYGGAASGTVAGTNIQFGGGGGGAACSDPAATNGGNGGGVIIVIASSISVSGTITTNGANSAQSATGTCGGGGGGGSVLIKTQTATLGSNIITANLGSPGGGSDCYANGGAGGIHLDYKTSYTGTTSPTLDARQDATLINPAPGFFPFL